MTHFFMKSAKTLTTDDDGMFTSIGQEIMVNYATAWMRGYRDLILERSYPDLTGSFYDVRSDVAYARRWVEEDALVTTKLVIAA
jgi:hypothetical protein